MATPMKYRRFGRTNLQIPVISCGGMRYQHSWKDEEAGGITPEGQANLEATIQRALELGINHIETARGYGTSEVQLGRILPRLPREKMIVQTKVSPRADTREFLATFNQSMSNLRLDYVDFLGIHGINNEELLEFTLRRGGCLEAARQFQKDGRVRFIGFSTHAVPRVITEGHRVGRIRLREPALVFCEPAELAVGAGGHETRHGRVHHQPERQGRETAGAGRRRWRSCARR